MAKPRVTNLGRQMPAAEESAAAFYSSLPLFRYTTTLDPQDVEEAWAQLSAYTPALELRELPRRLHVSLVQAIRESESLNKLKKSDVTEASRSSATLQSLRHAGL